MEKIDASENASLNIRDIMNSHGDVGVIEILDIIQVELCGPIPKLIRV